MYVSLGPGSGSPEYERVDATEIASRATGSTLSPGDVSRYWTGRALDYIRGQPLDWLRLEGRKLRLLLNVTEVVDTDSQESHEDDSRPLGVMARVAHLGVLLPLACLGIWITSRERRPVSLLFAMAVAYILGILAFYVVARYRLPLCGPRRPRAKGPAAVARFVRFARFAGFARFAKFAAFGGFWVKRTSRRPQTPSTS